MLWQLNYQIHRKHQTDLNINDLLNCDDDQVCRIFPTEKVPLSDAHQKELMSSLQFYMTFYGQKINLWKEFS